MASPDPTPAASVISAIASLVSALAWPSIVGVVLYGLYAKSETVIASINKFMDGKQSAHLELSVTKGFSFEIIQKAANASTNAVIESAKNSNTGALNEAQVTQVALSAQSAALSLTGKVLDPQKRLKVLWVDDHPENNTDLQFAFQALGIMVICVDSNAGIASAFGDATHFDVVITDIGRNGSREAGPEAGLKTVEIIRKDHPTTKVIIYAAAYAAAHRNDPLVDPVIQITNYPQDVYRTVVELATRKAL